MDNLFVIKSFKSLQSQGCCGVKFFLVSNSSHILSYLKASKIQTITPFISKGALVLCAFLLMFGTKIKAQSRYGNWTNISIEKKINKKWKVGLDQELRTINLLSRLKRWSIGTNIEYKIISPLRVGISYKLMDVFDEKYQNYQFRHRIQPYFDTKLSFYNFTFSVKEDIQFTTKNDSKRIKKNGKIDTYKINPAWIWKNTFKLEYNISNCKISPGYEFEAYYELNNPDGNQFEKIRNSIYLKYKINKRNTVKIFGLLNSEYDNDDNYSGKYIVGLKYKYDL